MKHASLFTDSENWIAKPDYSASVD